MFYKVSNERHPRRPYEIKISISDHGDEQMTLENIKDTKLKEILKRIEISIEDDARTTAVEIQKAIPPEALDEQVYLPICPMPTDLCRVSPFYPLNRNQLNQRDYLDEIIITKSNSWGEIHYSGPRLSTYDEDVLMGILSLLTQIKHRQNTKENDKNTYTYKGPILPLLKTVGFTDSKRDYERIRKSLRFLASAVLTIKVYKRNTRGKRHLTTWNMTNILSAAKWNEKEKVISITINPYFYETYNAGTFTQIELQKRTEIKSPIAKALYRFTASQRNDWTGHYLTLANALNMDTDNDYEVKRNLKKALQEVINKKILQKGSGFIRNKPEIITLKKFSTPQKKEIRVMTRQNPCYDPTKSVL
jgi:hypothetical protein